MVIRSTLNGNQNQRVCHECAPLRTLSAVSAFVGDGLARNFRACCSFVSKSVERFLCKIKRMYITICWHIHTCKHIELYIYFNCALKRVR